MSMGRHFLLYGHSGSYNHGAEALTRTTIAALRSVYQNCRITLSTHFADQDREFAIPADAIVERSRDVATYIEIYAPTIERIETNTVALHVGGDNYCYPNWQRWAAIHFAALERGAKSILWSCSIDPDVIDSEMLTALKTHQFITAREGETYKTLVAHGLTNVIKVSDIAFTLLPEPVDFRLDNYVVLNVSPLIIKRNPLVKTVYQSLLDYILEDTDMNIALVPHVVQSADNDYDALRSLEVYGSNRITLVQDKLSAGQYKSIIGGARFCVAARTHAAIAAYSSCVPTLAVGYSVKSYGIAADLGMSEYIVQADQLEGGFELVSMFKDLMASEEVIKQKLMEKMPEYTKNAMRFLTTVSI